MWPETQSRRSAEESPPAGHLGRRRVLKSGWHHTSSHFLLKRLPTRRRPRNNSNCQRLVALGCHDEQSFLCRPWTFFTTSQGLQSWSNPAFEYVLVAQLRRFKEEVAPLNTQGPKRHAEAHCRSHFCNFPGEVTRPNPLET